MTLALLITAAAGAWAQDTDPEVEYTNANTTASFTMPASDVTVNYTLVRDLMNHESENDVHFTGLPTTTTAPIIVKKGSDSKYQPTKALTIQLIDPLAAAEAQNIINADGITIKVLVGNGDTWTSGTLADFQADMKTGTYMLKAVPKDATSPYDGTVYSSEFTVVEQYDLTVKPANDFSKGKIESVTVGTESVTIDATTGEATKTGIAPDTEVKIKAKRGYVIDKVDVKKGKVEAFTVEGQPFYFIMGENWQQAIESHPTENANWIIDGNRAKNNNGQTVCYEDSGDPVELTSEINPKTQYTLRWGF